MPELLAFQAILIICATVAFVASLKFLGRIIERKRDRVGSTNIDGLQQRLERIELAVETTALEVERISEGNRFIAKALAERTGAPTHGGRQERVITPH